MIRLAVIGLGGRSTGLVRKARQMGEPIRVVAALDPRPDVAQKRLREAGLDDEPRFFSDMQPFLADADQYDGLILGTRCDLHAPLAVELAQAGLADKPLLLEKPVAISTEQLEALARAYAGRGERIVVSFPLRVTPLFQKVLEIVHSGRLGTVNQVQAHNNVSYGGTYFGGWYRDFNTTGGLWLQKATHDFDYINALLDDAPLAVAAMHTQRIYGGDMPEQLRCSECELTDTCIESPKQIEARGNDGGMGKGDHWCAFSESIRNQDAGSALLMYQSGVHAAYSQNFVTRRTARSRGARITGHAATLTFDWTRDRLWITDHHEPEERVTEMPVLTAGGHSGGDEALMSNFFEIIRDEATSRTPLKQGLLSAAMCLAARTSAATATFQPIALPGDATPDPAAAMPAGVETTASISAGQAAG